MYHLFDNLRARLIMLVLLAVIPAMVVTLASGLAQRDLARTNAEEGALRLTRAVAGYQMSIVEGAHQLIQAMALMPAIQPGNPDTCNAFMQNLHTRYPVYTVFLVADRSGKVYCSSMPNAQPLDISDRAYFQAALKKDDFVIGEPVQGRLSGKAVMPFAIPLRDPSNQVVGVLSIYQDLSSLLTIMQTLDLPDNAVLLMVDQTGTVLLRYPDMDKYSGLKLPQAQVIQTILNSPNEGHAESAGLDSVNRFYAFAPLPVNTPLRIHLSVGIPTAIAFSSVDRLLWTNLLLILGIAIMAILAAWFGGERLVMRIVSLTAERDEAERRLKEANRVLEDRVAQRTAELAEANRQLQADLTERKEMLQQLHQRERELNEMLVQVERSNQDLQNFAYIASHDLQEPLRKIQAFGDRLARRYGDLLSAEGTDFIQRMNSAAKRMQQMINDLLTYSRVTTRTGDFIRVDLNRMVADAISNLEVRISETNGQILVENLPTIQADPSQMRQLFQNLIGNALKFHRDSVPPVICVNATRLIANDNYPCESVILTIEDNGIGFDEKYLDRIFTPFQRLHPQGIYEGSGIGLAICRRIVERHAGQLTAQSIPGAGSRFIVTLPIRQVTGESELH